VDGRRPRLGVEQVRSDVRQPRRDTHPDPAGSGGPANPPVTW
jgi:hypothetical protein